MKIIDINKPIRFKRKFESMLNPVVVKKLEGCLEGSHVGKYIDYGDSRCNESRIFCLLVTYTNISTNSEQVSVYTEDGKYCLLIGDSDIYDNLKIENIPDELDLSRPIATLDGRPVKIIYTELKGGYSLVGIHLVNKTEYSREYTREGYCFFHNHDEEPKKCGCCIRNVEYEN